MARIKIVDLPADIKICPEEMKKIMGGMTRTNLTARAIEEDPWNTMPGPIDGLYGSCTPRTVNMRPIDLHIPPVCDPPGGTSNIRAMTEDPEISL